ncbi:MAG: dockerin type I repeat-containing protein [Ruminococcus sp.]
MIKKVLSIILVLMLILNLTITVFAEGTKEQITEAQYDDFIDFADACYYCFVNPESVTPKSYPDWSNSSKERMADAIAYAKERKITTVSELEDAYVDLMEVTSKMYVDKDELKFMYYLFTQESNSEGYYDNETWSEFQKLIVDAKEAYYSENEQLIHHVYIKMRNTFDDICTYNTVYGDFNGDGILNVSDITYAQKYLAESVDFNSSQTMLSYINGEEVSGLSIATVTYMQKYISGTVTEFGNTILDNLVDADALIEGYNIDPITFEYIFQNEENVIYSNAYTRYYDPRNPIYITFEI